MPNEVIIAFDVGGTNTKAAVVQIDGKIWEDTVSIYDSRANLSKDEIISHFWCMIEDQTEKVRIANSVLIGAGFAFPGPFDYQRGISYIKGLEKFESLYGYNLKAEFEKKLPRVEFDNDVVLFALGEYLRGKVGHFEKSVVLQKLKIDSFIRGS